jgi:integrase
MEAIIDNKLKTPKWCKSKMGYDFDKSSDVWQLDGSITVNIGRLKGFDFSTREGIRLTLSRYAEELSAATTEAMISYLNNYYDETGEETININGLTNWRATLEGEKEARLGALKSFLLSWHDWGVVGIESSVVDYLESLRLKGIIKGKAVKGYCPFSGPLTLLEQGALLDWVAGAFTLKQITLAQYALFLVLVFTGRRLVQVRSLQVKDLKLITDNNLRQYKLNIPRVKQPGVGFREAFNEIPIISDLYLVLKNQINSSIAHIEEYFCIVIPAEKRGQIPVFMEKSRIEEFETFEELYAEMQKKLDFLHMTRTTASTQLQVVSVKNQATSERTGEFINFSSRRFRYTKGTNLYRRGIQGVALAEALDHGSTQNIGVYTQNTVETAEIIDEIMSPMLAPLAQAFAGTLINSERDAIRGSDPHSRVKNESQNSIGNCGTHAFCASGYRACYTCVKFQPWKDAPHEEVRDEVLAERKRQHENGVSINVIQSTDRLLLSVEQVILMCKDSKKEMLND